VEHYICHYCGSNRCYKNPDWKEGEAMFYCFQCGKQSDIAEEKRGVVSEKDGEGGDE